MFVPDEEVGGEMGAAWMRKNHYASSIPNTSSTKGGFGSRDMFTPGKLVFGISVAEKKIMWLKLRAEGVAGHGSQPHGQNPNEHLVAALGRLFATPVRAAPFPVVETMKARLGGALSREQIQQRHPAIDHLADEPALGVGDPPRVNVIPSVAEATLDCRLLPGTTAEQWLKEVTRRLADPTIKIEVINDWRRPGRHLAGRRRSIARSNTAIIRHHPGAIVTPMMVPYGTDANGYRPRGSRATGSFRGWCRRRRSCRCTAMPSSSRSMRSARPSRYCSRR